MKTKYKILVSILLVMIVLISACVIWYMEISANISADLFFKGYGETSSLSEDVIKTLHGYRYGFSCSKKGSIGPDIDIEVEQLYKALNKFQGLQKNCEENMTCSVVSNKDGKLNTKICNAKNICLLREYNDRKENLNICYEYDEKGICTCGGEVWYKENYLVAKRECKVWDKKGNCSDGSGYVMSYNSDGKLTNFAYCKKWDNKGNCEILDRGWINKFDNDGRYIGYISCYKWESLGVCKKYGRGIVITYDDKGNRLSKAKCEQWNEDGTCKIHNGRVCYRKGIFVKRKPYTC